MASKSLSFVLIHLLSYTVNGNQFNSQKSSNVAITDKYWYISTIPLNPSWKWDQINPLSIDIEIAYIPLTSDISLSLIDCNKRYISYIIKSNDYKILSHCKPTLSPQAMDNKHHALNTNINTLIMSITKMPSENSLYIGLFNSSSLYSSICKINHPFNINNDTLTLQIGHQHRSLFHNKTLMVTLYAPNHNISHQHLTAQTIHNNNFLEYPPITRISRHLLAFGVWIKHPTVFLAGDRSDGLMAIAKWQEYIYLIGGYAYPYQLSYYDYPAQKMVDVSGSPLILKAPVRNKGQFYTQIDGSPIVYMIHQNGYLFQTMDLSIALSDPGNALQSPWSGAIIPDYLPSAKLPAAGRGSCLTGYQAFLYIVGGEYSSVGLKNVYRMKIGTTATLDPPGTIGFGMNFARQYLSCVVHPGINNDPTLYAIGGNSLKAIESVPISKIETSTWQRLGDLNVATFYARAVIYDTDILIVGGQDQVDSGNILINFQIISTLTGQVTSGSTLNYKVRDTAAIVGDDERLYAFGGATADQQAWIRNLQGIDLNIPTLSPTPAPTVSTSKPSKTPTAAPSNVPSGYPTSNPSKVPTINPSKTPTLNPSQVPTTTPTEAPSRTPTIKPSASPITPGAPTRSPTDTTSGPTSNPSKTPSKGPTNNPSKAPTPMPSNNPTPIPTDTTSGPTSIATPSPTDLTGLRCNELKSGDWNGINFTVPIYLPYDGEMYIEGSIDGNPAILNVYNVFDEGALVSTDIDNDGIILVQNLQSSLYDISFNGGLQKGIFNISISCIEYIPTQQPTVQPTSPPTPSCLSLEINVTDAVGFSADNFNGLYTYNPLQKQFNRPIWEIPQYPDGQNLKYYDGRWIIHAFGPDILSSAATTGFPPIQDLTAQWIHSNSSIVGIFHVWIRCINSYSPTAAPTISPTPSPTEVNNNKFVVNVYPSSSPTSAPTRDPTASGDIYDGSITIIYVLQNLTNSNYDFILNYDNTNAIDYISAIIESHYVNAKYLPSYQYFQVKIFLLNRIDYINDRESLTISLLYDKNALYMRSVIEFKSQYAFYLITTSKLIVWHRNVTATFREYFNNSILNFTVANSSLLSAQIEEEIISPSFIATFSTLNIILAICIFISFMAWFYNKYSFEQYQFEPCDSANWLAITFYGLQIYDVVSDINLTSEIFIAINDGDAHIEGKDKEGKIDSFKEYLLIICGWASLFCILIPYLMNIYYASRIPRLTKENICCRTWFSSNLTIYITLVVFSGGCYPTLDLISSGIFNLSYFNCGLSSFELTQLSEIRLLTTVLTENIPQLIIQILYAYSIGIFSPNTILAFCTSFASVIGSVLIYLIYKDKKGTVHNIDYYLEIKHNDGSHLTKEEKQHIFRYKAMKINLTKGMVNIYENIKDSNFEIGYVTIRKDDFLIRVVQHLHEEDLYMDDNIDINTTKGDDMNEYELLCYNLYRVNKKEIDDEIFEHYCHLDGTQFNVEYHVIYPGSLEFNLEKNKNISHININSDSYGNITQMVHLNDAKNKTETQTIIGDGVIMTSHYEFWNDRRDQFQRGYKLIKTEIEKLNKNKKNKRCKIDSMQINRFIRILNQNNINPTVIEDVINFAIESNTFCKENTRYSDIDETEENHHHDIEQQLELWAKNDNHDNNQ